MNHSQLGAFRNLRVLWFPFSIPATLLGASAAALSVLGIWLMQPGSGERVPADFAVTQMAMQFAQAWSGLFDTPAKGVWSLIGQLIWLMFIWGTLGLSAARCMVLRLARDEYVSTLDAIRFGLKNAGTALLFPLITISVLLLLAIINGLIGLAMQIPGLGFLFYILLPIAWICVALAMLISLTATLGSGLVLAAIAAEKQGVLDAWGKALNYIFARPIQFIIYIILTKIFVFDFIIGWGVVEKVPHSWVRSSLSRLHSSETFERILRGSETLTGMDAVQGFLLSSMESIMTYGIAGLAIASLAGAYVAMFLILRQDVDGIDPADISSE